MDLDLFYRLRDEKDAEIKNLRMNIKELNQKFTDFEADTSGKNFFLKLQKNDSKSSNMMPLKQFEN